MARRLARDCGWTLDKLSRFYLDGVRKQMAKMRRAVAAGDEQELYRLAHGSAGSSNLSGVPGVGERFRHAPWGVFGGEAGRPGRFVFTDAEGGKTTLVPKPPTSDLRPDQVITVETPGAGGYGPASERAADLAAEDIASGKVSG